MMMPRAADSDRTPKNRGQSNCVKTGPGYFVGMICWMPTKLNVITAYSGTEAVETLKRFPNIDGIVIDEDVRDIPFKDLIAQFKKVQPTTPVILIRSPMTDGSQLADYELDSFKPAELLELLEKLKPEAAKAIEKTNKRLADEN